MSRLSVMRRQKVRGVGNINDLLLWCTEHRPFSFLKGMVLRWASDQFSNTVWTLQWHCWILLISIFKWKFTSTSLSIYFFVLSPFHLNSCCMILLGTWLRSEAGRSWAYIHWSQLMFDCITGLAWCCYWPVFQTALHATSPGVWLPYSTFDHLQQALQAAPSDSSLAQVHVKLNCTRIAHSGQHTLYLYMKSLYLVTTKSYLYLVTKLPVTQWPWQKLITSVILPYSINKQVT